jgi:beta-glucosidase
MDLSARPLYSFGYGLSYTTFIYNNLTIERQGEREMKISFDVTNTGKYDGEEVAQLYLHKAVASTVQPEKQLKCFRRVMIHKGETRHFEFVLGQEELSIIDRQMNRVTEPGEYDVMIGPSSDDIALKGKFVY